MNNEQRPITDLRHKFTLPVAVLGGAPSLPDDYKKLPKECITIAANHHAFRLGIETDFLVFKDDPKKYAHLKEALVNHKGIVISKLEVYTDYVINVRNYDRGFTGMLSVWIANYITTGEVIICGMDAYSQKEKYFHNQAFSHNVCSPSLIRQWKVAIEAPPHIEKLPNPERVSVMSGPLQQIFKPYEEG